MKTKLVGLAFAAIASISSIAHAAPVVTLQTTTDITVNESFSAGKGFYSVTNNLASSIVFFAVSAKDAHSAATTRDYSNTSPLSLFGAKTVTEAEWSTTPFNFTDFSLEAYFGTFDDVFGTEDNVANVYFELDGFGISPGEVTGNQFSYLASKPASNWIALTGSIGGSAYKGSAALGTTPSPSAVPVPAAAWLFVPVLLGFMGLRRKAKTAA